MGQLKNFVTNPTTKYYRHKSEEQTKQFELIVNSNIWYNQNDEKIEASYILSKKSVKTITLRSNGTYHIFITSGYYYYTEKPNHTTA